MSLNVVKNTHLTRNLTATDADGKPYSVVSFSGQVNPGKSVTFSMVLSDAEEAEKNSKDVSAAFADFLDELRAMARDNGLPV